MGEEGVDDEGIEEMLRYLETLVAHPLGRLEKLEVLDRKPLNPSIEEPSTLEIKYLPAHLKYVYFG